MKTHRLTLPLAAGAGMALGSLLAIQPVAADPHSFSANLGAVSNYIWRGQSQTDDKPAIQGGLDYAHESGFYAGTWASNVDFGDSTSYELDLYLGFGGSLMDELSYDLSAIYYAYPDGRDTDFAEISASMTYMMVTAGLAYTVYGQADGAFGVRGGEATFIQGDLYFHTSLDFELPYDLGLSLRAGYYDFDYNDGGNDYAHWGVSISREAGDFGTFSFNYDQVGRDTYTYDDEPKFWIGWLKEF